MVKVNSITDYDALLTEDELAALNRGDTVSFDVDGSSVTLRAPVNWPTWDVPSEGEVLRDTEAPHWSNGRVTVEEVPGEDGEYIAAEDYTIRPDGVATNVAQYNYLTGEDREAPVVVVTYESGDRPYAMPITRLERL